MRESRQSGINYLNIGRWLNHRLSDADSKGQSTPLSDADGREIKLNAIQISTIFVDIPVYSVSVVQCTHKMYTVKSSGCKNVFGMRNCMLYSKCKSVNKRL